MIIHYSLPYYELDVLISMRITLEEVLILAVVICG